MPTKTTKNVFILNLTGTQYFKIYHSVERLYWDDETDTVRVESCSHADGRRMLSTSALIHIDYAKKFAMPCKSCFPEERS